MQYSHIFGPVNSRRLGRSLGIDLVPLKTCNYDCVYCECGRTTRPTGTREVFFPEDEVILELSHFLSSSPALDFVTFAGSGEPTLSLSLGRITGFIKERFPGYRVAVLTNSSLLSDPGVRRELLPADVVLPTFSAASGTVFGRLHRPFPETDPKTIRDSLARFREEYRGEIWLEVFIVPGLNDTPEELALLREAIGRIRPDRVHLNTLDRPGTDRRITPAAPEDLKRIARVLGFIKTDIFPSSGPIRPMHASDTEGP